MEDGQSGEPARVAEELIGTYNVPRAIMDTKDAAEKLEKLYQDKDLRYKYGLNGRRKAVKYYDYDRVIGPMWDKYYTELLDK